MASDANAAATPPLAARWVIWVKGRLSPDVRFCPLSACLLRCSVRLAPTIERGRVLPSEALRPDFIENAHRVGMEAIGQLADNERDQEAKAEH